MSIRIDYFETETRTHNQLKSRDEHFRIKGPLMDNGIEIRWIGFKFSMTEEKSLQ